MGKHVSSPPTCTPGPNLQKASVGTQGHKRNLKSREHTGSHLQHPNAGGTGWPRTSEYGAWYGAKRTQGHRWKQTRDGPKKPTHPHWSSHR